MMINFGQKIDALLKGNGHTRDEIVCVLWGDSDLFDMPEDALSIDVESFWKYADETVWEDDEWVSGPHYPLWLLSDGEWWLEATTYDSRTDMKFVIKPKQKKPIIKITKGEAFRNLEVDK